MELAHSLRAKATEFQVKMTRRQFCQSTATVALATAFFGASALPRFGGIARADNDISVDTLMKADGQPDIALGDAKAPVTIVEYASMTCPHCAHFEEAIFHELKKRYIDTGKARFILRDFPLDNLAGAVFVLQHCIAKGDANKYYALVQTFFSQQRQWAVEKPVPPLMAIAKQAGLNEQDFNACLSNQKAWDAMESVRQRAMKEFKVESTPTFFVNGTRVVGAVPIEDFAKVIDPYLKGG
jgi:protein-disulfide isomerase